MHKEKPVEPSLSELISKGDFYRSHLDEYLKNHSVSREDAMALAGNRHWAELLLDLEVPDHFLPEGIIDLMCKHNGATSKLFNFLQTKVQGIETKEDLFTVVLKTPEGRYNLLQDLHREHDGFFEYSTNMFKKLITGFGPARARELSSSICWYVEEAIDRGRFTDLVLDEKFLNFLMDQGVIINVWLAAKVSSLSWGSFERTLKNVTDESHGRDRDLAEWTLIRALGERQWVNDQRWIEPVHIADNQLRPEVETAVGDGEPQRSSWLDLALEHHVLPLLLKNGRLEKVSGWKKHHVDALVEQTINNLSYNAAQEKIDDLIAVCHNLPGFSLTPELVKKFLDLHWDPKDTYPIDENFLGSLLDKNIPIDFSVANRVSEMSWNMFRRVVLQSGQQGARELRRQMFERLFGEKMAENGGPELAPLTVAGAPFDANLLDIMMQTDALTLVLKRGWFDKISGIEMRHITAMIKKIRSGSSAEDSRGYIDKLIAERTKIPALIITRELFQEFLQVGWRPAKLEDVDCLVEMYDLDLLKQAADIIRPLLEGGHIPAFSRADLEKITGDFGAGRKFFIERKTEAHEENLEKNRVWRIAPHELEALAVAANLDEADLSSPARAQTTADVLKKVAARDSSNQHLEYWRDPALTASFARFGETFGFDKAFAYYGYRPDTNRHDAYHEVDQMLAMFHGSGLQAQPEKFYSDILQQISRDTSQYGEENSYRYFNTIVREFSQHENSAELLKKIQAVAAERSALPELQEFRAAYKEPKDIFSSWPRLRLFYERLDFVSRTELLDTLEEIKQKGEEKKYRFAIQLLTHKDSKVSVQALRNLLESPYQFFDAPDKHIPEEIQKEKKPSNYFNIPHLDLTAQEFRDAYMGGKLDSLQALPPMTIEYEVNLRAITKSNDLRSELKRAIGSREKGSPKAEARRPDELRRAVENLLKPLSLREFIQGEDVLLPTTLQAISQELYYSAHGIPAKAAELITVRAAMNQKGDPEAAIAGDDTASCMALGTGKMAEYIANPGCAQFTLQLIRPDGTARTIAQSVMTKDIDIKKPVDSLLRELRLPTMNEGPEDRRERLARAATPLHEILRSEIVSTRESYISADNVEVNPNFIKSEYRQLASEVYRDFFRHYLDTFAEETGLHKDTVPVGKGHSDALTDLKEIKNTFLPRDPVGYSDKLHADVYALRPQIPTVWHAAKRRVTIPTRERLPDSPPLSEPSIEYLTFEDALVVSSLESKIYSDNASLMTRWADMKNALIAKDTNNAIKNRPNLSIKYTDKQGNVTGYMLAYEGVHKKTRETIIYISDMATEQGDTLRSKVAGARLVHGLTELYQRNYIQKENLVPIYAEARETTSYRLIVKNLQKMGEKLGIDFVLEEGKTEIKNKDIMHAVTIRPVVRKKQSDG